MNPAICKLRHRPGSASAKASAIFGQSLMPLFMQLAQVRGIVLAFIDLESVGSIQTIMSAPQYWQWLGWIG
jgi:hypothetical protein